MRLLREPRMIANGPALKVKLASRQPFCTKITYARFWSWESEGTICRLFDHIEGVEVVEDGSRYGNKPFTSSPVIESWFVGFRMKFDLENVRYEGNIDGIRVRSRQTSPISSLQLFRT